MFTVIRKLIKDSRTRYAVSVDHINLEYYEFSKSSGTTNARSKFLPISPESMEDCHYRGGKDMMTLFVQNRPDTSVFDGQALSIGGSLQPNPFNPRHEKAPSHCCLRLCGCDVCSGHGCFHNAGRLQHHHLPAEFGHYLQCSLQQRGGVSRDIAECAECGWW